MILHTDIPSRTEIERLLAPSDGPCVSIYLPTHLVTAKTDRDRLLLRDLTRRAVQQLAAAGSDKDDVEAIEASLVHLAEDDDEFWIHQAQSLAVFASPTRLTTYRLPNHLVETVEVSDRFHVKPLLRAVTFPNAAWILAVSQGAVRLLELGPEGAARTVHVDGLPRDARQVSGTRDERARELAYARKIDAALRPVLTGSTLPLIVAASQPMMSVYTSANTYPHLAPERLHASPEESTDAELGDAARTVLDHLYAAQLQALGAEYTERIGTGRAASDVSDLARLATLGAVETLIVDMDANLPGSVDDGGGVTFDEGDDAVNYGVLDEVARRVLLAGGDVLAVRAADVPGGGEAAALLRFAV